MQENNLHAIQRGTPGGGEEVCEGTRYCGEVIMRRNETVGNKPQQYKGYCYYKENPSLAVWEQIKQILQDCGLV